MDTAIFTSLERRGAKWGIGRNDRFERENCGGGKLKGENERDKENERQRQTSVEGETDRLR